MLNIRFCVDDHLRATQQELSKNVDVGAANEGMIFCLGRTHLGDANAIQSQTNGIPTDAVWTNVP